MMAWRHRQSEVLAHNVERLVTEHQELSKEAGDKGKKVEELQTKITELLEKNQVWRVR